MRRSSSGLTPCDKTSTTDQPKLSGSMDSCQFQNIPIPLGQNHTKYRWGVSKSLEGCDLCHPWRQLLADLETWSHKILEHLSTRCSMLAPPLEQFLHHTCGKSMSKKKMGPSGSLPILPSSFIPHHPCSNDMILIPIQTNSQRCSSGVWVISFHIVDEYIWLSKVRRRRGQESTYPIPIVKTILWIHSDWIIWNPIIVQYWFICVMKKQIIFSSVIYHSKW